MQTKWNGRVYSLEKFFGLQHNWFVQLQEAADHINFQFPTKHSILGLLIDNMSNSDPDLHAAIAILCINTDNIRNDFERDAGFYSQCAHMQSTEMSVVIVPVIDGVPISTIRGFTEIGYVPKSRVILKKNRWCPFCFFFIL